MKIKETIEILTGMRDIAKKNQYNYSMYGDNPKVAEDEIDACETAVKILETYNK